MNTNTKKIRIGLLFLALLGSIQHAGAQTDLPNWDMNTWVSTSWGDSLEGWSSTDWTVDLFVPTTLELSPYTPGVSGYGASIETNTFGFTNEPIIGILMNGQPTYSYAPGVGTAYVSGGGTPISIHPTAVEGSFLCTGTYDGLLDITLTKWNTVTHSRDTIGYGHGALPVGTSTYTNFSVPIVYGSADMADTICVLFYSSDPLLVPSTFASHNTLVIDNVTLAFDGDIVVSSIDDPIAGSNILAPQPITATIQNNTVTDLVNPNIYYSDGVNTVSETYVGTVAPGASLSYTFSQLWTPTASGPQELCVYVDHAVNDNDASNDTLCINVIASITDLELISILAPADGSVVSTDQPVTVQLYNSGSTVMTGFDVSYSVNSGTWIVETITTPLSPGATMSYTFIQIWSPSVAGNFEVCAAVHHPNDYDLSNDSLCVNITSNLTVSDPNELEFALYPNPSNGLVNVISPEEASLSIFDAQGRLLFTLNILGEAQLNLTYLSDGVYFYQISTTNTNQISNGKLIIDN